MQNSAYKFLTSLCKYSSNHAKFMRRVWLGYLSVISEANHEMVKKDGEKEDRSDGARGCQIACFPSLNYQEVRSMP